MTHLTLIKKNTNLDSKLLNPIFLQWVWRSTAGKQVAWITRHWKSIVMRRSHDVFKLTINNYVLKMQFICGTSLIVSASTSTKCSTYNCMCGSIKIDQKFYAADENEKLQLIWTVTKHLIKRYKAMVSVAVLAHSLQYFSTVSVSNFLHRTTLSESKFSLSFGRHPFSLLSLEAQTFITFCWNEKTQWMLTQLIY